MRRLLLATLVRFGLACLASAAAVSGVAAGTVWLCGLGGDGTQLVCVAEDDPVRASAEPLPTAASAASNPSTAPGAAATVRGTQFPLDPRRRWVVDFWSPGADPERLEMLARATICYRSPGCEVVLAWPVTVAAAPLRR